MDLREFKAMFDPVLAVFVHEKKEATHSILQDELLVAFLDQAELIITNGGKRARPYVAYIMYDTVGGEDREAIFQLGVALELFHVFCLIHDDIIDRGQRRHDVATVHTLALEKLKENNRLGDLPHVAESQALLVGDLVLSWAYDALSQVACNTKIHRQLRALFARLAEEVILGQMMDVDIMTYTTVAKEAIDRKMEYKTARYTFVNPLLLGLTLAGQSDDSVLRAFCEQFGLELGLAFQIQDDLLDVTQNTAKSGFRDFEERQPTYLSHYIETHGTEAQKQQFAQWFGQPIDTKDYEKIQTFLHESGAVKATQEIVSKHFATAKELLNNTPFTSQEKELWSALISFLENRSH